MKKKNGFTLIELIAVLVILAILALIVTPLVMNIIRKARISADKRSIDAYGRSIELAIANYLLDNGDFPTDVSQLTIEYSGDEVVCTTTQLNSDSSVYLAGCTVGGRSIEGYTYGKEQTVTYDAYEIGDEVNYNNINYYVIKDSSASEEFVTLLKAEPLSVEDVNIYGVGHVNRYTFDSVGTAYDVNGYGGLAYYSSETCGYKNFSEVKTGCTTDYAQSEVKYVVDAWASENASVAAEARLITLEDLKNLGYSDESCIQTGYCSKPDANQTWLYISNCWYWSFSQYNSPFTIWYVNWFGDLGGTTVYDNIGIVRPVITISKSYLY